MEVSQEEELAEEVDQAGKIYDLTLILQLVYKDVIWFNNVMLL